MMGSLLHRIQAVLLVAVGKWKGWDRQKLWIKMKPTL